MKNENGGNGQVTSGANGNGHSVRTYFELHGRVLGELPYMEIEQIGQELLRAYEDGRRVYLFGNGGSASLASHLACDLGKGTVAFECTRKRFQVMSLTDNMAV